MISVEPINLTLLKRQKLALLRAMRLPQTSNTDEELLQGILNLLDHIHDQIDPPKPRGSRP